MKANELRIGNYFTDGANILIVKSISDYPSDGFKLNGGTFYEDLCLPIPLTEEWLIKFGFEYDKFCGIWNFKFFSITTKGSGYVNSINGGEYDNGIEFNYVHQLQNLYFALTGEELCVLD
jgi:hypothetical protein